MGQLPLSLTLPDESSLDTFFPGKNLQVLSQIKQFVLGQVDFLLFLWGQQGVGCSHLLQGACNFASENSINAMYLPLLDLIRHSPKVLQNLEKLKLICIDDIQAICGNKLWEEAIFHFFNKLRANNSHLLVASKVSPKVIDIGLPDLKSRLNWGISFQIVPPSDDEKIAVLQQIASKRGINLSKEVGQFMLTRCVRNMGDLFKILEKLDEASLAAKRKITIPFIKQVLKI